jgi:hypothetical protein
MICASLQQISDFIGIKFVHFNLMVVLFDLRKEESTEDIGRARDDPCHSQPDHRFQSGPEFQGLHSRPQDQVMIIWVVQYLCSP